MSLNFKMKKLNKNKNIATKESTLCFKSKFASMRKNHCNKQLNNAMHKKLI